MYSKLITSILFCQIFLFACSSPSTPAQLEPTPPIPSPTATVEVPRASATPGVTFVPASTQANIIPTLVASTSLAGISTPFPRSTSTNTKDNLADLDLLAEWGRGWPRRLHLVNDGQRLHVHTASELFVHDVTEGIEGSPIIQKVPGALLLSNDGQYYATEFDVRRVIDDEIIVRFLQDKEPIPVGFSPDGKFVAVQFGTTLQLFNLTDGTEKSFTVSRDVAFSLDSSLAAIQGIVGVVLYDLENDVELTWFFPDNPPTFESRAVTSVAISPDKRFVAIGYMPGDYINSTADVLEIYRISDGAIVFSMEHVGRLSYSPPNDFHCDEPSFSPEPPSPSPADKVMYSPDGRYLGIFFGTAGPTGPWRDQFFEGAHFYIYNTLNWQLVKIMEERVSDAAFTLDSQHVLIAFPDGRIEQRRILDGAITAELDGYSDRIEDLALSVDDSRLVVQHPGWVALHDAYNGELLLQYPAREAALSPGGNYFALGYPDGTIELREVRTGDLVSEWSAHADEVSQLLFLPSGDLVSSSVDCTTYRWRIPEGALMFKFEDYIGEGFIVEETRFQVESLMLLEDGETLVGEIFDAYLPWNANNGEIIGLMSSTEFVVQYPEIWGNFHLSRAGDYYVHADSVSPRRYFGWLTFFDKPYENELYSRPAHFRNISGIQISSDGTLIYTGSIDGTIRIWGIRP